MFEDQLNAGQADEVIAGLKPDRHRSEDCAVYIRNYPTSMDCKRGLPNGTGGVESSCKQIVGSRFKAT